ncbi:hypothetical protein PoB_000992000 [Plakobranchus ocellatus]|uniref:SMB domain-containing protein n=1 Tax=Plakobranchus ocellatus TaxID=259542 RepID=A0AAV3YL08_9GAST|nr:hypothetical protein PoB_000992000 [Plakobranchus ocellatus]
MKPSYASVIFISLVVLTITEKFSLANEGEVTVSATESPLTTQQGAFSTTPPALQQPTAQTGGGKLVHQVEATSAAIPAAAQHGADDEEAAVEKDNGERQGEGQSNIAVVKEDNSPVLCLNNASDSGSCLHKCGAEPTLGGCSCVSGCVEEGSCCGDYSKHCIRITALQNVSAKGDKEVEHLPVSVKHAAAAVCDTAIGAMLISYCPQKTPTEAKAKCEGNDESPEVKYSMSSLFPVSTDSGRHYRNYYCYSCWEAGEPYLTWALNLTQMVQGRLSPETKTVKDILTFIQDNPALTTWIPPDGHPWPACPERETASQKCFTCGYENRDADDKCSRVSYFVDRYAEEWLCYICISDMDLREIPGDAECAPPHTVTEYEQVTLVVTPSPQRLVPGSDTRPLLLFQFSGKTFLSWSRMECDYQHNCTDTLCGDGIIQVDGRCDDSYMPRYVMMSICLHDQFVFSAPCNRSAQEPLFLSLQNLTQQNLRTDDHLLMLHSYLNPQDSGFGDLAPSRNTETKNPESVEDESSPYSELANEFSVIVTSHGAQSASRDRSIRAVASIDVDISELDQGLVINASMWYNRRAYINWAQAMRQVRYRMVALMARAGIYGKMVICVTSSGRSSIVNVNFHALECKPLQICPGGWRLSARSTGQSVKVRRPVSGLRIYTALSFTAAAHLYLRAGLWLD